MIYLLALILSLGLNLGCTNTPTGLVNAEVDQFIAPESTTIIQTQDASDGIERGDTCWWGFYADPDDPSKGLAMCAYKQKIRNPMIGGNVWLPVEHSRAPYYIKDSIFTMHLYPVVRIGTIHFYDELAGINYYTWTGDPYDYTCTVCNPTILQFDITVWNEDSMYLTARTGTWGGDFDGSEWNGFHLTNPGHSVYHESEERYSSTVDVTHHNWILLYENATTSYETIPPTITTQRTYQCDICKLIRTE